ncbi:hypothetical protein ACEPPN_019434 [Leptodophora sp. 'Broadleaf-Isolate-01']
MRGDEMVKGGGDDAGELRREESGDDVDDEDDIEGGLEWWGTGYTACVAVSQMSSSPSMTAAGKVTRPTQLDSM